MISVWLKSIRDIIFYTVARNPLFSMLMRSIYAISQNVTLA
jgi:hypothetical protein